MSAGDSLAFCPQAMKRVRTEQIQYAVAQYLKRRQYVDTDGSLKGAKLSQSAEEMAASLTGRPGSAFTLLCVSLHTQADSFSCDHSLCLWRENGEVKV